MSAANTNIIKPEHGEPHQEGTTTPLESTTESSVKAEDITIQDTEYPEGGARGWATAIGASVIMFSSFGYANAYGVFQEYYQTHQLSSHTPSQISWIGSLQIFFLFSSMSAGGYLFDRYGTRFLAPSLLLLLLSIFLTSIATKYWHFILAQGVLGGLSMGIAMAPAMGAVGHFFNKKRGAAMGMALAGSSLGGLVFPIMLGKLLYKPNLSFGWTIRIAGFIILTLVLPASLMIKTRLPRKTGAFYVMAAFKNKKFLAIVISSFLMMFGLFTPFFYLPSYAVSQGMSAELASFLIAILNASSFFGRVVPGVLGDKFGRVNIFFFAGIVTAVMIFCFTAAKSNAQIIVYSAFYGFFQGGIVSGMSVLLTTAPEDQREIGTFMGLGMSIMSIATLIGPPINGAMLTRYHSFTELSYLSGAFTTVGALSIVFAKVAAGKGMISIS